MNILKKWIWPVVAGFIAASMVMVVFEYTNSFFFPIPDTQQMKTLQELHDLTASLPWTAYILVFLGWACGSFVGGYLAARLAGENKLFVTVILTILLVLAGIADMLMIGFPLLFAVIGTSILAVFPYFGFKTLDYKTN